MLAYLDALLDALTVRDGAEAARLLAHPLARILTDAAREEARAIADGSGDRLAAPLRLMQLRHLTAELLREAPILADRAEAPEAVAASDSARESANDASKPRAPTARRLSRLVQMELPLSA